MENERKSMRDKGDKSGNKGKETKPRKHEAINEPGAANGEMSRPLRQLGAVYLNALID